MPKSSSEHWKPRPMQLMDDPPARYLLIVFIGEALCKLDGHEAVPILNFCLMRDSIPRNLADCTRDTLTEKG